MAGGNIYMVDASGGLRRMSPSAPESEDRMQELVALYPELITDGDGDLLLVRREQAIGDSEVSNGRWSVDHLFVTRGAVPVLVELKRAVDTRLRREVVGQMLDYAANASAYWQAGRIADSFAATAEDAGSDPGQVLTQFIGERDPAQFWAQVDANFAAGRIKLVFVADNIPRELARIVEFLNDQMQADVRAIELRWFSDESGTVTLSPRVIGETERAAVSKAATAAPLQSISRDEWLAKNIAPTGDNALQGARAYIEAVENLGGLAEVAKQQGSIFASFEGASGRPVYPFHLWADGQVSLSLRWLKNRPVMQEASVREEWMRRLEAIVGPLSTSNLSGFPAFRVELLAEPSVATAVESYLRNLVELLKG